MAEIIIDPVGEYEPPAMRNRNAHVFKRLEVGQSVSYYITEDDLRVGESTWDAARRVINRIRAAIGVAQRREPGKRFTARIVPVDPDDPNSDALVRVWRVR